MSENNHNRRVQKTLGLLKNALISLITEKDFDSITIKEILDRANVGRSTFYLHFNNKQELLHYCFIDFHELLEQSSLTFPQEGSQQNNFVLNVFKMVEKDLNFYKAFLGNGNLDSLYNPVNNFIYQYFVISIRKMLVVGKHHTLNQDMMVHYISNAFIGTLRWWINNNLPCTAEEISYTFNKLALNDINMFSN